MQYWSWRWGLYAGRWILFVLIGGKFKRVANLRGSEITDRVIAALGLERGEFQRHFGSDQSVCRDGDWNGFVRIALAGS